MSSLLSVEQRAAILAQLEDAQAASDGLLESFGRAIADRRAHSHPTWEDLFCMNLSSFMGERAAPVLRRLLEDEEEIERLKEQVETITTAERTASQLVGEQGDRLAELQAELRIGSPWKCHVCGKDNSRDVCVICETDRPDGGASA